MDVDSVNVQLTGSATFIPEIEDEVKQDTPPEAVRAIGVTQYGYNVVGPRNGDVIMKSTGWNIAERPTVVICQARQMDNLDRGWPDQFNIQVIETSQTFIRYRVRRMDDGTGSSSWGQNLRVDVIVIN